MNLTLQDYIETELFPKLSHHVKYSDFFEKQYDYFRNETSYDAIIVINCKMIVEGELVEKLKLTLK